MIIHAILLPLAKYLSIMSMKKYYCISFLIYRNFSDKIVDTLETTRNQKSLDLKKIPKP